jgi:protein-S-isoprenylcysteine O-methyltransferase Ste14
MELTHGHGKDTGGGKLSVAMANAILKRAHPLRRATLGAIFMAVKASLTYGWPSGIARLQQLAATLYAPSNLSRKSMALDLVERAVIFAMYCHFAFRSIRSFTQSSDIETLLLLFSELLPFLFILLRRSSATLSDRPLDWFFGFAGTTAVLLITPATVDPLISRSACLAIMLLGIFTQVSAKVALGLSFGIVAANRGVRVEGPYRFVRHPMYAGYTITHVGLLLAMPSIINALLYAAAFGLQIVRIQREERILCLDPAYKDFAARVRYRLLPLIY